MKKILIAAGGTGGHIKPALSIAKYLQTKGYEILYIGNKSSMEENLVQEAGLNFRSINVQKLYRYFTLKHLMFPFKLAKSIYDSCRIIKEFKPDVFLGTGGFVMGPVAIASIIKKIPIFLQEQNSFPGITTRIIGKFSLKIFLGNENAKKYLRSNNTKFTGNPVNEEILKSVEEIDFAQYGLKEDSFKVFLFGGSQGSLALNKIFISIIDQLLERNIEIIWQTGKYSFVEFHSKMEGKKGVYLFDFTSEMDKIYNSVNLSIARAGAISIAELETKKIPTIFIPLACAAGNHQFYNAKEISQKHCAKLIEQKDLSSEILLKEILEIKANYNEYKNNFKPSIHLNATKLISENIESFLKGKA